MSTSSATKPDEFIRELFAATDTRDTDLVASFLTDDIELRFGNAEPVRGKPDFRVLSAEFNGSLAAIRHEIVNLWEVDEATVVTELRVHYTRLDGQKLTLPCANVFRLRDGLVYDYRIYMDIGPVFATD